MGAAPTPRSVGELSLALIVIARQEGGGVRESLDDNTIGVDTMAQMFEFEFNGTALISQREAIFRNHLTLCQYQAPEVYPGIDWSLAASAAALVT